MFRKIRAAAIAAAMTFVAGTALIAGPAKAWSGEAAIATAHYLDPAGAANFAHLFGLQTTHVVTAPAVDPNASLDDLVTRFAAADTAGGEQNCLANAVYFEARGEPLRGQLAVAEVVLNRAASGRFPGTLCGVVAQPAQFSFVRHGRIPQADRTSEAWRRAVAIARIALQNVAPRQVPETCLWYHADYVSPGWGHRLAQTARIGLHIFYS
jgi:spore germination cell wall hydrolase CwlJ-like protein